mgnify:FL=1
MSTADEFDVGTSVPSDKLEQLHTLLEETIALEGAVTQMEEDLKAAKATLHNLRTTRIPDLMAELQMEEVSFKGWQVKVDDFVSGSLPKDAEKKAKAIAWLEANDAAGLIKTEVGVSFGRSEHEAANSLWHQLESDGLPATLNSNVHAQTLQAFARQRIRDGDPIDTDALGLYVGKVAKMKEKK